MRGMLAIFKRELRGFFVTPVAYSVAAAFVFLAAFFFFNYFSDFYRNLQEYAAAAGKRGTSLNLNDWVVEVYYHTLILMLVFIVPLLTMRSFPAERRQGTYELLMTSPVSVGGIVLGKYLAVLTMLCLVIGLSLVFPALLCVWGQPGPEGPPLISGAGGVLLCAAAFASVALGLSALVESQLVAGLSALVVLLLLYVIFWPAKSLGGYGEDVLKALSPVWQANDLIDGVVTLSSLVYFASLIVLGLFAAVRIIEWQRDR